MISNTVPELKWTRLKILLAQWQDWQGYRYILLYHLTTVHCTEFGAQRVGYVEVMTPCFATDVLAELLKTLELSETGSGWFDFVWANRLRYQQLSIIDETAVLHTRPVASAYIERLKQYRAEMRKIMYEHQTPGILKSCSGFRGDGSEIKEGDRTFLYRLFHGYERMFAGKPERFREMIKLRLTPFDPGLVVAGNQSRRCT